MTPKDRIDAVLDGRRPDRPPFSFWYHFPPEQAAGPAALKAHLDQFNRYGMDFLKVMNDNPYPHPGRIGRVEDLASLVPLKGDEGGFSQQLELIAGLKATAGERVHLVTTIFNAWAVLRQLIEPPKVHKPPNLDAAADVASRWIHAAYAQRPELVTAALRTIGDNLARFGTRCLRAGADGVFLSVRDDWVETQQPGLYDELVRSTDRAILAAISGARLNILHVCGKAIDFRAFADYPVALLNWADRAAGPSIGSVATWTKPVLCGGVDNLGALVTGTPEQVRAEVRDALDQAGNHSIVIAPGCTFDPQRVPLENLDALADAARAGWVKRSGPTIPRANG